MNETIYRVGMYTGKIYGPEIDPTTIQECCRLYCGVPIINEIFPSRIAKSTTLIMRPYFIIRRN